MLFIVSLDAAIYSTFFKKLTTMIGKKPMSASLSLPIAYK